MLKVRRTLLVLLAVILVVSLVGCGGQKEETKKTAEPADPSKPYAGQTIRVLYPINGQYHAQKARVAEFEEKTGIKVEYSGVAYGDMLAKLTAEGLAGAGYYDVVNYLDAWGPALVNFLETLDNYVTKDNFDLKRFPNAYIDQATFNGKLYGIPLRGHPQMLYYRKDVFQKLNMEPPKTWEEVEKASKLIKEKTGLAGIAMYYGKGKEGQNLFPWFNFLWGNGADVFDKDYKPIFNNRQGVEATQRYVDLMLKHKITPDGSVAFAEQESMTSFGQGSSAMWLGWWWAYATFNNPEMASKEVVGNVGFAEVPVWEGKTPVAPSISLPTGIMAASKQKEAAWEYIKWVSSPEVEKDIVVGTYKGTNGKEEMNIVVTNWVNLRDPEINQLSGGLHELGAKSLEISRALPKIPEWPQVSEILSSAISDIASGKPVQDTLDKAATAVEQVMEKAGYYKK